MWTDFVEFRNYLVIFYCLYYNFIYNLIDFYNLEIKLKIQYFFKQKTR